MSRAAKKPLIIPQGATVTLSEQQITVKGGKGSLQLEITKDVKVTQQDKELHFTPQPGIENAATVAGTIRALIRNMLRGVTEGYERKLTLIGVGYRAKAQGKVLNLSLGFSHPVDYSVPEGITIETPSQTEIVVKGIDKHLVGQVAAEIRAFRPPEPYKGKGVRYADEYVVRKEGKKK